MTSIKRRLWTSLAAATLLIWCIFFAMLAAYWQQGRDNPWKNGLAELGDHLLLALPDAFANALVAAAPGPAASGAGPSAQPAVNTGEPGNILTALALNTLQLLAIGFLLGGSVVVSLRPLKRLSAEVAGRLPSETTPIPQDDVPSEIAPLIGAFNTLLARVDHALRSERDFIAQAAHELRTPMSALHTYAEAALMQQDPVARDALLRQLIAACLRTSRLADQLLDQARLEAGPQPGQWVEVDAPQLVRHLLGEFSVQANLQLISLYPRLSPCRIRCDVDAIGILLRNLVDNAMRHGGVQGIVEVSTGYQGRGEALQPYLEVLDDGPGIAESERSRVFERFYRTPGTAAQGSGIGLSLVATIAAQHGAEITCGAGANGRGVRVRVVFPAVPARS
ncbi:hypothetical protein KQ945_05245 [Bacillus subtilis subsp. subtilis]|nr:hypothetical protein [Bacillus subtilis subsp. subtilis]